ncbi:PHB depolymerase family esterase [uncultured Cohaesibacter sp.]|uniref:PHB depolymerase family esterase n=1 Tax=uncultured Cohaesibacter sp. TaxID=1002546 RepID=UPI0029C93F66|nr:PHB depolymerase family esterase [uncultured Cohaesibacter sp.]
MNCLSRRTVLVNGLACLGAACLPKVTLAASIPSPIEATAITEVFGHGERLVGIAIQYAEDLCSPSLSLTDFLVEGRTVTNVITSASADPSAAAPTGNYVLVMLDPEDNGASLYSTSGRDVKITPAEATVTASGIEIATSKVNRLIVDDFKQLTFVDDQNNISLMYNLFVPRDYDPSRSYPLINFMHDASVTSSDHDRTLIQGLGAVVWAHPEEQAKRPCIILAPQFDVKVVNDGNQATGHVDTVKRLIEKLATRYNIDMDRLYTTGQSGGGMLSIAMNIKYPEFFAASFLVACQWGAELVEPMKDDRLFIVVSAEDQKAYPGQNAITQALEGFGATVNRATWNGRWTATEFNRAYKAMRAENAQINYVVLEEGTVIPEGADTGGAAGHMNTWPIAYTIEGVREWLFEQSR